MSSDSYVGYLCFLKPDNEKGRSAFAMFEDRAKADAWKERQRLAPTASPENRNAPNAASQNVASQDSPASHEKLKVLMGRFSQAISGYQMLASVSMSIMPIMRKSYLIQVTFKELNEYLDRFDEDEEFVTFGFKDEDFPLIDKHLKYMEEMREASKALPGAILLSLVATFDTLIVDIITIMLKSHPDRFVKSQKSMTVAEVLSMKTFDDVINKVISEELDAIMRKSHSEQIKYIENEFNIKFPRNHERWGNFIEIFERRNLTAHGDLIANSIYIKNCSDNSYDTRGIQSGTTLKLSHAYLVESSDVLIEFGIELICLLWRKNFRDTSEQAYEKLGDISFELIQSERYVLASRLLEFAIGREQPKIKDELLKRMTINLANSYKNLKNEARCKEIINKLDWSAASDDFKICIASLENNIDEFVRLMPRVADVNGITKIAFREWPVFAWVREDPKFVAAFKKIYGEDPIRQRTSASDINPDALPPDSTIRDGSFSVLQ